MIGKPVKNVTKIVLTRAKLDRTGEGTGLGE